ncbi:MAG: 5-methyltetrahydropteroyltriglutamate--homocysteine S-methyltransferase [Firmicutes bacterium]|nr:5-methyltetrahydropteroyltriglutamate--homocysteine S-methyltransferase [Bacillota bacterium]
MSTKLSVVSFPRIGAQRELKKLVEGYFAGDVTKHDLCGGSRELRQNHWRIQQEKGIDFISSNDFSLYDNMLDMACLLNDIPSRYRDLSMDELDRYFAMAKGAQNAKGDVKALELKKWFNTNYHYIVPETEEGVEFKVNGDKPFAEFQEALALGINTKAVLIGPYTFLKLSRNKSRQSFSHLLDRLIPVYQEIIKRFSALGMQVLQIDEPALVMPMDTDDVEAFCNAYQKLLPAKGRTRVLLQTYFGDIRDILTRVMELDFDALGLDLVEGERNLDLIEKYGFPSSKQLFAGLVDGKNIWINNYTATMDKIHRLLKCVDRDKLVLSTSCSLLHVPYSIEYETKLGEAYLRCLSFAREKLSEMDDLRELLEDADFHRNERFLANQASISELLNHPGKRRQEVRAMVDGLTGTDFVRQPAYEERIKKQKQALRLPLLPTTTIGSFPQTTEIRKLRQQYRSSKINREEYAQQIRNSISQVIKRQEELGLDVLVHGEYERNDMVEYFGENLEGFLLTENGWVQSYGTRAVKPPVIFGDIKRSRPITLEWITYAQSLTEKPVKGMLTGPITILNWSFPREDLELSEIACQLALAIKEEVMDLERAGIKIIQIDEAALREKLPLRKEEWQSAYLDWAIKMFRLVHASVGEKTQIHTHMCYSEFSDIIGAIEEMDADVYTFEAARSDLSLLRALREHNFTREVGPGVYDIHSLRIPTYEEIKAQLEKISSQLDVGNLWVNPDCGLKTRGMQETLPSLANMVKAAETFRSS